MKLYRLGFIALFACAPASAQNDKQIVSGWDPRLDVSLSPRIGTPLPFQADDSPVDESEAEASLAIAKKDAFGFIKLEAKVGIASSPQLLDDTDATSSIYGQVAVGDAFIPFRQLLNRKTGQLTGAVSDAWRPYARYRFSRHYTGSIGDYSRDDHQITLGLRYRDVRTIMAAARLPAATAVGAASETLGWYWEARAEVSQIWSTDSSRQRLTPLMRMDIYSRPIGSGVRIFGRAQGDIVVYDQSTVISGNKRVDKRVRLTIGADVSDLVIKFIPGATLEIAGQYQKRWSNEVTAEHERVYFTPALIFSRSF